MKNSFIKLGFLILSAILLVYFLPNALSKMLFLIYCIFFFKSKNNVLWIIFFIILIEAPGGLFSGQSGKDLIRLPIYTISNGISISFEQLFILTAFFKAFNRKQKFTPLIFMKNDLKLIGIYFVFEIILSVISGISFANLANIYKIIINLTLFYSVFHLLKEEVDFVNLFEHVFPFAIVAFILQFYDIINGHQLITLFKPEVISIQGVLISSDSIRPIEMVNLLFLCFYGSLYFLFIKKIYFSKKYLLFVNVISFISIYLTATRAWFLAFAVSYLLLLIFNSKELVNKLVKNIFVLSIAVLLLFTIDVFKSQFTSATKRLQTIELLAKGDITAGGTLERFSGRAPKVINAYKQSSILFGAGFSDFYWINSDGHIGFHNFLFNVGIIGLLFPLMFVVNLLFYSNKLNLRLNKKNPYKKAPFFLMLWVIAVLILNGSTQFIGYDIPLNRIIVLSILIYFSNNQIKSALHSNMQLMFLR